MDDFTQCDHPMRVAGMCAVCGKALDDDDTGASAQSQQLHDISGVQVTNAEAARLDSESTKRLLDQRKLALIVDLDQTIIHATVDPTVGEWMKDVNNPNNGALADVGKFLLGVDGKEVLQHDQDGGEAAASSSSESDARAVQDGCWYYVKPRPGLQQFLKRLSETFEMHVYTMGTRTYAESVCRLVDPQGAIFGARIISRDENGSLVQKSLKKLFPMDTSMVVIIDDRADVWQWSPHLIRVTPFDFFVGIGDINATFLPSLTAGPSPTPEAATAATATAVKEEEESTERHPSAESDAQAIESQRDAEAKAKAEDDAAKSVAEESQKSAVNEQLGARPLAKMQEALEEKDAASSNENKGSTQQAAVLKEDDRELDKLQGILEEVHSRWYAQYASGHEVEEKPTTRTIISQLKTAVLDGCIVVFSSIAPLQQDPTTTDLWRLASEFGAVCKRAIDSTVTHVVTARQGTEKVIQGHRRGLHVVWFSWLQESCACWVRQPEAQYELPKPKDRLRPDLNGATGDNTNTFAIDDPLGQNGIDDLDEDRNPSDADSEGEAGSDDDQGFGEMNWDEANDEVDAELEGLSEIDDLEDEDDDVDDDKNTFADDRDDYDSDGSATQGPTMKRSRSVRSDKSDQSNAEEQASTASNQETLSPLSKRRRMAELRAGHSKLKQVMTRDGSQAPSTGAVGGAATGSNPVEQEGDGEDDSFLLSLEEELELQLGADESGEMT